MSTPNAAALLRLWEQGQGAAPPERALLLLSTAEADPSWDTLEALPLGARDGRLLLLRERLFGRDLTALAACPLCAERVELALDTQALRVPEADVRELQARIEGIELAFRLPTGGDLIACSLCGDVAQAERLLLERCLRSASKDGQSLGLADLPPAVVLGLAICMSEADPGADLELELRCPACEAQWRTDLDIASYLWTEVQDWALRILRDVHQLASAYGWSESDILALSPLRRRLYLEMAAP